ncbi:MAG: T9SS type A sorting domain-containing protein [Saprospiraceae bacterium]
MNIDVPGIEKTELFNIQGQLLIKNVNPLSEKISIPADQLQDGLYLLIINKKIQKKVLVLRK